MSYRELTPHPALRPFVDRLWIREASAATRWHRILPDGCIDLLLDPARPQAGFVVGAMTRAVLVPVGGPSATVAVRFRPGGATPFLRTCADQLTDARIDLGQLQLRWQPPPQLEGCRDLRQAADLLQQALLDRLASVPSPDPRLAFAVKQLFQQAPPAIAELAADIGWTRQHAARLFQRQVGIGPKLLARVARLHRAVVEVQARPGPSLAQAALAAGYFDQAHMDRDFRELVGRSPAQVREDGRTDPGSIRPIRSLLGEAEPGP
jgi:AraC-like DNA-binding protein